MRTNHSDLPSSNLMAPGEYEDEVTRSGKRVSAEFGMLETCAMRRTLWLFGYFGAMQHLVGV